MLGLPCGPVAKTPCSQCRRHGFDPWSGDYPCGLAGKESTCNTGDLGSIPGLGRSPGEGKGYPLQYSGLENSKDIHGVAKSWTWLSNFQSHPSLAVFIIKMIANVRIHLDQKITFFLPHFVSMGTNTALPIPVSCPNSSAKALTSAYVSSHWPVSTISPLHS